MVRFARTRRVFFIEEPVFDAESAHLTLKQNAGVHVVTPHLVPGLQEADVLAIQNELLRGLFESKGIRQPLLWFYTPMALPLVDGLPASAVVYDCMDELSGFARAPIAIRAAEAALLKRADVVFTGGQSLYEAKRSLHGNVHAFPSSVDVAHFARARTISVEPRDQAVIPHPRIGFCGVIDERMNLDLVARVAERRPEWHLVLIGPTAKIDAADLPQAPNIHYLGMKQYDELPAYFSGWDVAMMPFAHNAATRFISPTKTPEYLAAGCPVVSTSIRDVVRPYGERGYVAIADSADDFCAAIDTNLTAFGRLAVASASTLLKTMSWDRTFEGMQKLIDRTLRSARRAGKSQVPATVEAELEYSPTIS
jgi:glycosyltransferase involved in cell wall biosynthesis